MVTKSCVYKGSDTLLRFVYHTVSVLPLNSDIIAGELPGIRHKSVVALTVKNLPAMRETWVQSLGQEDPWRRAWQPTPVLLPGESPWTEELGGLNSMVLQRVRHDLVTKHLCTSILQLNFIYKNCHRQDLIHDIRVQFLTCASEKLLF